MQVSLLSKRGVPDDAIISIRSGQVRRQGAVIADRPLHFPQTVSDADCVVKVDLMQTIGSGYLVMRPNQTEGKQYEVIMGNNQDIACELEVTPTSGAPPPAAGAEDAAAAAKSKQDAKAYLDSTGLLAFVQGVLQVVAKQQPEDPFAAMAKHFLSASDQAEPPAPGSPKAAPASPKAVEAAPASPKADAQETSAPASPKAEVEETNAQASPETESESKAAPQVEQVAAEVEEAESEQFNDQKSDTLEEFTATVKNETNAALSSEEPAGDAAPHAAAEEAAGAGTAEGDEATQPEASEPPAAGADDKKEESTGKTPDEQAAAEECGAA